MKKIDTHDKIAFLFIVPTLNSYKKLPKLVNSLNKQSYQNWRCLFVDGSSEKNHKKWIESTCKRDNRFININENKNKKGIYPAMSEGFKIAKDHEWIIFLGSDDWFCSKNSIKFLFESISKYYQNIDLVISSTDLINPKNQTIIRSNKIRAHKHLDRKIFSNLIYLGYMPAHQSMCFSSNILRLLMPYSYDYDLASDADLILRLSLCKSLKKILFIKEKTINIGAGGISSKNLFKRTFEVFKIYGRYYKFYFLIPFILRYLNKFKLKLLNLI